MSPARPRVGSAESGTTLVEVVVAAVLLTAVSAAFVPSVLAVARTSRSAEEVAASLAGADLLEQRVGAAVRAADDVLEAGPDRLVVRLPPGPAADAVATIVTFVVVDGRLVEERVPVVDDAGAAAPTQVRVLVASASDWRFAYRTWDGREVTAVVTDGGVLDDSTRPLLVRLLAPTIAEGIDPAPLREVGAWSLRFGDAG